MHELAVTAAGRDRPGIVAAVTRVLHERGGNLDDCAMTVLGGHVAIVLQVVTDDDEDTLHDALAAATGHLGLTITVARTADDHAARAEPTHLLNVYGTDRPGIVAGVTGAIAEVGATITDLETQVVGTDATAVYAMVIEVVAPDPDALAARVDEVCRGLGIDHTLRAVEVETY